MKRRLRSSSEGYGWGLGSNLREDPHLFDGLMFGEVLEWSPQHQQAEEFARQQPDPDYDFELDSGFSDEDLLGDE